jgi:hypothetical protein
MIDRELAIGRIRRLMHWAWERGWFDDARHYERLLTKYENMSNTEFYNVYIRENENVSFRHAGERHGYRCAGTE